VRAVFRRLDEHYAVALGEHGSRAAAHLEAHVERYRKSYGRAIRELRAAHETALAELRAQTAEARTDAAEVKARSELLRQRSDLLAAIARARAG
jgi:hypothetical protein